MYTASRMVSALDQSAHTKLKFRQPGQGADTDLKKRDLHSELEARERKHIAKTRGINFEEEREKDLLFLEAAPASNGATKALVPKALDADAASEASSESSRYDCDANCSTDADKPCLCLLSCPHARQRFTSALQVLTSSSLDLPFDPGFA